MVDKDWRVEHRAIIEEFLQYLNEKTDMFVLKGGTALMECYGLTRFSEDIDLDGPKGRNWDFDIIIESFAIDSDIPFVHNKNTNTTDRYFLHYNGDIRPLKIETSFREQYINPDNIVKVNGIQTYELSVLTEKKVKAFDQRDKLRDLYDLIFICKEKWNDIDDRAKENIKDSFSHKGIEYFETIVEVQKDEFIDSKKLEEDFIDIWDKIELSKDDDEDFIETDYEYYKDDED